MSERLIRLADNLDEQPQDDDKPERVRDFELDPPIEFQKKRFERLHLCEPTGRQVERAEQELEKAANTYTMRRYMITLIAQTARVPREVVEMMPVTQIEECFDFLAAIQKRGPSTGETSSPT